VLFFFAPDHLLLTFTLRSFSITNVVLIVVLDLELTFPDGLLVLVDFFEDFAPWFADLFFCDFARLPIDFGL